MPVALRAGVGDRRVGDQRRVAAGGGDGQDLRCDVAGPGGDAGEGDVVTASREFSRIAAGLAIELSVGAWLTGVTVTVKVWVTVLMPPLAVPPLSVTVTVIVAVPLALATGVKVSVPVLSGLV